MMFVNEFDYVSSVALKNIKNKIKTIKDRMVKDVITNIKMENVVRQNNKVEAVINIDQAEILRKNSLFGDLFDLSDVEEKINYLWWGDIFSLIDIKIVRKRVKQIKTGRSSNPIFVDFDKNEPIEIVVAGSENRSRYTGRMIESEQAGSDEEALSAIQDVFINQVSRFNSPTEYPNSSSDIKASLRDNAFFVDPTLTLDRLGELWGTLMESEEEYPVDPANESKILFPWVRELLFTDFTFSSNPHKTGLYQYGIEVTFQDGVLRSVHENYNQLVRGRAIIQEYKRLLFGTEVGRSPGLVNFDPVKDRITQNINNSISSRIRVGLNLAVVAYNVAYERIYKFVLAQDPESEAVHQLSSTISNAFADSSNALGEKILTFDCSREDLEIFFRSYDIVLKTTEKMLSYSISDVSSIDVSRHKITGARMAVSTFTVKSWFEPEIDKGIVDMRNHNILMASVLAPAEDGGNSIEPVYSPEAMKRRLMNEFFKFGVDQENFLSSGLGSAPATLTIESILGSNVWSWQSGDDTLGSNPALFGALDLVTEVSANDRGENETNLEKKNPQQLKSAQANLLEKANSYAPSGISVSVVAASGQSPTSSKFQQARNHSTLQKISQKIKTPPQEEIEISFEPGEECLAYSQNTQRALIEHQRHVEKRQRTDDRRALERKQAEKMMREIQPILLSPPATTNEADDQTAEPPSLAASKPNANSADAQVSPLTPVASPAPKPFSVATVKKHKEEKTMMNSQEAMPLQLIGATSEQSNYGKVTGDKLSTAIFGNIVKIEKVTGYDKDEKGKPNLKSQKTEKVSVEQVMNGLLPGKYILASYFNIGAGIPASKQMKKTDTSFVVKAEKTNTSRPTQSPVQKKKRKTSQERRNEKRARKRQEYLNRKQKEAAAIIVRTSNKLGGLY